MDHESGRDLLELLGGEYHIKVETFNFTIKVRDAYYILEMIFIKEPPKRA